MPELACIIATKDRPEDLRSMLGSLDVQSLRPQQVIIVDASAQPVEHVARAFPSLPITYVRHWPPSAAAQRNAGLSAVQPGIGLIGFMDDDIVLEPGAVERMLAFWARVTERTGGASFNCLNPAPRALCRLKAAAWVSRLGLYSEQIGGVAPNGWQEATSAVQETVQVQWLPSTAAVWRREVFAHGAFDPYFEGYSYLEDLDFSYGVGKRYELFIVADAGFRHYPSPRGRVSRRHFGRIEVANRLYVVRKHRLSTWRCYLGLGIRMGMTVVSGFWQRGQWSRAAGNIAECLVPSRQA